MTTRTVAGLRWRAVCPSYWELEHCPGVAVVYLGDGTTPNQWFIQSERSDESWQYLPCGSREEACKLVAIAFEEDTP